MSTEQLRPPCQCDDSDGAADDPLTRIHTHVAEVVVQNAYPGQLDVASPDERDDKRERLYDRALAEYGFAQGGRALEFALVSLAAATCAAKAEAARCDDCPLRRPDGYETALSSLRADAKARGLPDRAIDNVLHIGQEHVVRHYRLIASPSTEEAA